MAARILFAMLALLAAAAAHGGEMRSARYRLEEGSVTGGGGASSGASGVSIQGSVVAPVTGILRGPASGIVLRGGLADAAARPFSDADGDGVADRADRCVLAPDAAQRDSDGDDYGNACDADLDGDGRVGFADLARLRDAFFSDDADADLDGDGRVNAADLARFRALFGAPPGPSGRRP